MAHRGFGELVIIKDGAKVTVPRGCITKTGAIKSKIKARLECLTVENIKALEKKGVICEIDIRSQA